jgi:transcriptional regulator of arginine metabolism
MNVTRTRRRVIRSLLVDRKVGSQEELLHALAERGVQTTQPALSRDLRALKAAKRDGFYQLLESERVTPLQSLASLLRGTCPAGPNMVVVRCEPGAASAIARALEAEGLDGLLGTVAGDDTVFAAVRDADAGDRVRGRVISLLEESP